MKKKTSLFCFSEKRIIAFVILFAACLCLGGYIFELSAMTSKESAKKSDAIYDNLSGIVAQRNGVEAEELPEKTQDAVNFVVRKSGHLVLFALFGVLTYFLAACFSEKNKMYWFPSLFSLPFCIVYAISDEIHQTFVAGRHGKAIDVIVDAMGAVIGTLIAVGIVSLYRRMKKGTGSNNEEE